MKILMKKTAMINLIITIITIKIFIITKQTLIQIKILILITILKLIGIKILI